MAQNAPMRPGTPTQKARPTTLATAAAYPKHWEILVENLRDEQWRNVLMAFADAIRNLKVRKAASNKTGRRIDITVQFVPLELFIDQHLIRLPEKGCLMELHIDADFASMNPEELLQELVFRFMEKNVCSVPCQKTTRRVTLGDIMTLKTGQGWISTHVMVTELLGILSSSEPGPKAVYKTVQEMTASTSRAFSAHVMKKVTADITKLAVECFKHGATMEDLQAALEQALVKSVMES